MSRFTDAKSWERCQWTITLSDKTTAQCGRRKRPDGPFCTQHENIEAERRGESPSWVALPVAAAAYLPSDRRGGLTHAYNFETREVLCRRVKPEHILDDGALAEPIESVTCTRCRRAAGDRQLLNPINSDTRGA